MKRAERAALAKDPPPGWGLLFAPVPQNGPGIRSSRKIRCLLCGTKGYGTWGPNAAGRPSPWQVPCIAGHPFRCETCRRVFSTGIAISAHRRCRRADCSCCLDHTSVPAWRNPFRSLPPSGN